MSSGVIALLLSTLWVTIAEMGDKTQLLAVAFASKYKASKVLIGVFIATVLNHGLAVALGSFLVKFESIRDWIQLIAALSFIFFGLWTIKGDKLDEDEVKTTKTNPVLTVSIAFFIAELGDKTQLTTIALAAKHEGLPFYVLIGTTLGMLIADSIGILFGAAIAKKVPEKTIKILSSLIFILFGLVSTYQSLVIKFNLDILNSFFIIFNLLWLTGITWYILSASNRQMM